MACQRSNAPAPVPTICIGFGQLEGKCMSPAGSTHSELWCQSCDDERLLYLGMRFNQIAERFLEKRSGL